MCLYATFQKSEGDPAPKRTIAYKVVEKRTRRPIFFGHRRYTDGSEHRVFRSAVMASHKRATSHHSGVAVYRVGFHVFTDLQAARNQLLMDRIIIMVEVNQRRWVADGTGGTYRPDEAVYTGLKVIGRVK